MMSIKKQIIIKPTVSVIVPVYNCAAYLERCLSSIAAQTLSDMEIIIIEDGSTDGSDKIAESFVEQHDNWQICKQENSGVASARNKGLELAHGEYIAFVDSDDYIDATMLQKMLETAKQENADLVVCNYREDKNGVMTEPILDFTDKICFYGNVDIFLYCIAPRCSLWNKLIKREVIGKSKFLNSPGEEMAFFLQLLPQLQKAVAINETMYYYVQRSDSIMGKNNSCLKGTMLEVTIQEVFPIWKIHGIDIDLAYLVFLPVFAGFLYTPGVAAQSHVFFVQELACMKEWESFSEFCKKLVKTNDLSILFETGAVGKWFYQGCRMGFWLLNKGIEKPVVHLMKVLAWWFQKKRGAR